jgi:hypothetical protein
MTDIRQLKAIALSVQSQERRRKQALHRPWWRNLLADLNSIRRTGKTRFGLADAQLWALQVAYEREKETYYAPMARRKQLSPDTLFSFSGVQLIIELARHSVKIGDYADAYVKVQEGHVLLREASSLRFYDEMRAQGVNLRQTKPSDSNRRNS